MTKNTYISVIIPVKNGASTLPRCLESIRSQINVGKIEIIIIDSGSTDSSVSIAKSFGATVSFIEQTSFNHGLTRNLGTQVASGKFIFFTVQDAFLSSNNLLENMSKHFDDPELMAVVGHQAVPHEKDKNPLQWFKRYTEPIIHKRKIINEDQWQTLAQEDKSSLITWDNVVAMYRRDALLRIPFQYAEYAEDWIWCKEALLSGWTVVYDPSLVVFHYHHQSYQYAFKTNFIINYIFFNKFQFLPKPTNVYYPIIQAVYHIVKNSEIGLLEKLYWIFYNVRLKIAIYRSVSDFLSIYHKKGLRGLQTKYKELISVIPQGVQN